MAEHSVIEIPPQLQATTADPFIADIAGTPEAQERVDAYRARLAADPTPRIYD
jgi:hypothetical protein